MPPVRRRPSNPYAFGVRAAGDADYIRPCNDTSSACLIKATQDALPDFVKGLPHLGVPTLDPYDLDKSRFVLRFHCNITIKGQYTAIGRFLVFQIDGEGDAKIKLTNLNMTVDINTKYVKGEDSKWHFALKDYSYTFDYGDKMTFMLSNLFKQSKELTDTVLMFLNENWRIVAEEFGKPIVDYSVDLAIRTIEKFFLVVPYEELTNVPIPVKD
ncbi:Circadian clock-controlled protein [Eumeta japonica]|uniref:Circadian clock-controlled protein n=1 Tax=Eumeta variegata TaxID=151549 RepID=A0A4C1WCG6_EUMVA|nr:Circadian clock-controlled protein [Eumeta japonica]